MKLYKHHKNKPYLVHGVAKHSETMEELVVYETRYDNPTARLWVRPKAMFEEVVVIEGKAVPRFAKVPLKIETSTQIDERALTILSGLIQKIFGEKEIERFRATLRNHSRFYLQLAFVEEVAVGFKLGYERDRQCFYSWLDGVLPEFQKLGIARDLIEAQHEWCRKQGYHQIQTQLQNRWKSMLILNLKEGFEIVGYHASPEDGPEILLEKQLGADPDHDTSLMTRTLTKRWGPPL